MSLSGSSVCIERTGVVEEDVVHRARRQLRLDDVVAVGAPREVVQMLTVMSGFSFSNAAMRSFASRRGLLVGRREEADGRPCPSAAVRRAPLEHAGECGCGERDHDRGRAGHSLHLIVGNHPFASLQKVRRPPAPGPIRVIAMVTSSSSVVVRVQGVTCQAVARALAKECRSRWSSRCSDARLSR